MNITHYDLFAGIGGFSLALEEVFPDAAIKHIFCEWEQFPTAVLKQHWPDGEFHGDIAELVAYTASAGFQKARSGKSAKRNRRSDKSTTNTQHEGLERVGGKGARLSGLAGGERTDETQDWTILTGGFPCQPFSHAGRRHGTADDRYQWPNMFQVIRNTSPEWVIAENVRGLVTWNEGLVLETVCADLEGAGYEVQPFIIPAVSVGAPHRRDRVWIIAHSINSGSGRAQSGVAGKPDSIPAVDRTQNSTAGQSERANSNGQIARPDADAGRKQRQSRLDETIRSEAQEFGRPERGYPDWGRDWREVAATTSHDAVDDGLPRLVDGVPISRAKWRQESLKAYGNGIVHQVATEIIRSIRAAL